MKLQVTNLGKVAITVEEEPWSINKAYDRLTIVEDNFTSYISRIAVPKGQPLVNNRHYWVPFGTRNGAMSVNSFTILSSESQLPLTEDDNDGPYLIKGVGYFWVGTRGNAVDGKYQTIEFQGPKGDDGKSAYELYRQQGGTLELNEWIASLKGEQGNTGKSAYEIYLAQMRENTGNPNFFISVTDWLTSLEGTDGKSAYELAKEHYEELNLPADVTFEQWYATLKGPKGDKGDKGDTGTPGAPGTNGRDGKDGKDGANGSNGVNGANGKDGYTPYIGANGNWWINGTDTGKPSRGPQGPQGPAGDGGGSSNVYIDEANKRVVLVVGYAVNAVALNSPPENASPLYIGSEGYVDFQVNGSNLSSEVQLMVSGNYTIKRVGAESGAKVLALTPEEVNAGEGVLIRVTPNPGYQNANSQTTVVVTSTTGEFTSRIVSVIYQIGFINVNLPGQSHVNAGGIGDEHPGVIPSDDHIAPAQELES